MVQMARKIRDIFNSEFLRNVATLVSGTGLAQGVAIAIYPILSRIYTPADFGLFALYMSILSITMILATGKYDQAIMLPKEEKDATNLLGLSFSISTLFSFFLLLIILSFNHPISRLLGNEEISAWLYFIPLSTLLVGFFQAQKFYSNRKKKYKGITVANVVQSFTNSGTKLGVGPLTPGATGLIAGTLLGQLTGFLSFLRGMIRARDPVTALISRKGMLAVGKEYNVFPRFKMVQAVINNLSGALPVLLFTSWFSSAVAGLFSFGFSIIFRPMNLVLTAFFQVLSQKIIEKFNKGESIYRDLKKFIFRLFQLVVGPFILMIVFAPAIFRFVFGPEWEEAGKYTQIMVPWLFAVAITMPLSFIPDLFRRQRKAMILDSIGLLLRAAALGTGIWKKDVYMALSLFTIVSTFMVMINFLWYVSLVRRSENKITT